MPSHNIKKTLIFILKKENCAREVFCYFHSIISANLRPANQRINYNISLMGQLSQIVNSLTEIWLIRKIRDNNCSSYSIKIHMFAVTRQEIMTRHQMETFSVLLALVRGIHWSPVNSPYKGQWCGLLIISLICTWANGWVNNQEANDLRQRHAHFNFTVMYTQTPLRQGLPEPLFQWNYLDLERILIWFCFKDLLGDKATLVKITNLQWITDKALSKPIKTEFSDTCVSSGPSIYLLAEQGFSQWQKMLLM